eukprot:903531-Amphidinium_carterae.1
MSCRRERRTELLRKTSGGLQSGILTFDNVYHFLFPVKIKSLTTAVVAKVRKEFNLFLGGGSGVCAGHHMQIIATPSKLLVIRCLELQDHTTRQHALAHSPK